jgi:outer membrane protein assembly factor BamE (lipoprotein component of BamABCDE complex)
MKSIVASLSLLILTACAGSPFSWQSARQIQPGMTTAEVSQLVGTPNTVKAQGDVLTYVWVYVNTMFGTTRTLRVDFKDGKAISAPPIPAEFQD